jgi:ACS family tartrate transporter-like MFS transporter
MPNHTTISAAPSDDIAERVRRRVMWRLLPYLLLLYLIAYIDRTNIGVAKLQMTRELKFTETIIGFGAGIFFFGYFLLEIPGSLIVERWSARKWIARIMISWGIVATLMGFIGTPLLNVMSAEYQFYVLRFILGAAEAGFFPGIIVYLSHWFRLEDRARAKAKFLIGIPLATIVGVPLSRFIQESVTWYGWSGWRWVFILEGIPSIILGITTLFYLTDRPHQAKWLSTEERHWLTNALEQEKQAKTATKNESIWTAFRHPQILLLMLVYFSVVTGNYGLSFFIPSITENLSLDSVRAKTIIAVLPYLCAFFAVLYGGRARPQSGNVRLRIAIPFMIAGAGLIISVLTANYLALSVMAMCLAGFYIAGYPAFWSMPTALLGGAAAATAVGLINSVGNLGGFLGPYLVGYLKDRTGNYHASMWLMGSCLFIAGLLATRLRPPQMK